MAESKVEELGITVVDFFGSEPKTKAKQCNRKIKLFREFVLATLCSQAKSKKGGKSSYISACDSFAASGIAGLQWKKHLKSQVHVSLADQDDLSKLTSNVKDNSMEATEIILNSARVSGDPFLHQNEDEVHVYKADARALLSMEAFHFIYLNPNRSSPEYLDTAFHSVTHGGVVCFVVSDVSAFGRAPHVIRRQYAARVIKTEYWKEMAARTVLASMALAAARCNKGIVPQYTVALEDYLLLCVKVGRGHVRSEAALNEVVQLLHCRFCEERVFMEIQLAPEENPYRRLPCKCKQSHLGKTAVLIGPMWKGAIFNYEILCEIQQCGLELKLSNNFTDVIKLLIMESFGKEDEKKVQTGQESNPNQVTPGNANDLDHSLEVAAQGREQPLSEESNKVSSKDQEGTIKRKPTEDICDIDAKKTKKDADGAKDKKKDALCCQSSNVPFYYNVHKVKANSVPKFDKVISLLHNAGYKASRTHFDVSAIRTTANFEQFIGILSISS